MRTDRLPTLKDVPPAALDALRGIHAAGGYVRMHAGQRYASNHDSIVGEPIAEEIIKDLELLCFLTDLPRNLLCTTVLAKTLLTEEAAQ